VDSAVSILIMRHFPTSLNAGEGRPEMSRSWSRKGIVRETAEPMAEKAARIFDRHGVTDIGGSDLPRAAQSAKLVAEKMKSRPVISSSSQARTWNTGQEGQPELKAREERKKFVKHPDEPMPGGESFNDFRDRVGPYLQRRFQQARALQKKDPKAKLADVLHGHEVMDAENVLNGEPMKDEHWARLDEIKPGHVMELRDDGKRVTMHPAK
jgi:broad specificity phosphatase PhoE